MKSLRQKNVQKLSCGAALWRFFLNFASRAEHLVKKWSFSAFWENSENQFGRPKKVHKIFETLLQIHPPPPLQENPRSDPELKPFQS